jgi:threonine dehydrogenase-like Zn-dependent dehydrogenase
LCALAVGAGTVLVAEPNPARRAAAAELGMLAVAPDELVSSVATVAGRSGAGAVGADAALALALEAAGPRGTVVVIGAHHGAGLPFPAGAAFARELTVAFVAGDPILVRDELFAVIRSRRVDPTAVGSDRLQLSDVVHGYQLFDRQEATKVVLVND